MKEKQEDNKSKPSLFKNIYIRIFLKAVSPKEAILFGQIKNSTNLKRKILLNILERNIQLFYENSQLYICSSRFPYLRKTKYHNIILK